jgi:hypothetical protein
MAPSVPLCIRRHMPPSPLRLRRPRAPLHPHPMPRTARVRAAKEREGKEAVLPAPKFSEPSVIKFGAGSGKPYSGKQSSRRYGAGSARRDVDLRQPERAGHPAQHGPDRYMWRTRSGRLAECGRDRHILHCQTRADHLRRNGHQAIQEPHISTRHLRAAPCRRCWLSNAGRNSGTLK